MHRGVALYVLGAADGAGRRGILIARKNIENCQARDLFSELCLICALIGPCYSQDLRTFQYCPQFGGQLPTFAR